MLLRRLAIAVLLGCVLWVLLKAAHRTEGFPGEAESQLMLQRAQEVERLGMTQVTENHCRLVLHRDPMPTSSFRSDGHLFVQPSHDTYLCTDAYVDIFHFSEQDRFGHQRGGF